MLTGGTDKDVFVFKAVADSTPGAHDTITDFARLHDKIDVSAIDAVEGGEQRRLHLDQRQGLRRPRGRAPLPEHGDGLTIQGDVDGDGVADLSIAIRASYHSFFAQDLIL